MEISRAGPTTTVFFFSYSWHWCGFCRVLYGSIFQIILLGMYHKYARVGVKLALRESYFDLNFKSLGATNLCLRYAPAKCGKFDVSQCFFQFCYRYLKIWHLLFAPHCMYTNRDGDSLFIPFCTIGISMYQKSTLPYTLFLTYLPQAYSPFERSGLTDGQGSSPLVP